MFTRDLKPPEVNIAAVIPHQNIENFKNMRKLFRSTADSNAKSVNEIHPIASMICRCKCKLKPNKIEKTPLPYERQTKIKRF